MIPTLVNALCVAFGGVIGIFFSNLFSDSVKRAITDCIGLVIIYLAVKGMTQGGGNTLVIIFSLVLGGIIGTLLCLDDLVVKAGEALEAKFAGGGGESSSRFAAGFAQSSTIFCVGAMAVVGSVEAGLGLGGETIYAKCILDFVVAIMLAGNYGLGVAFSALFVIVFQGIIVLASSFIGPYLSELAILQMDIVGSILLVGVGTNMLKITKIKMMNLLPAIFVSIIICAFL